jgi:hypothetical protein
VEGRARARADRELTRLIRQSRLLDPVAKRQWLRVLYHLAPADRAQLEEILRAEQLSSPSPEPPPNPSR